MIWFGEAAVTVTVSDRALARVELPMAFDQHPDPEHLSDDVAVEPVGRAEAASDPFSARMSPKTKIWTVTSSLPVVFVETSPTLPTPTV